MQFHPPEIDAPGITALLALEGPPKIAHYGIDVDAFQRQVTPAMTPPLAGERLLDSWFDTLPPGAGAKGSTRVAAPLDQPRLG